jgi:hypothetical protein
MPIELFDKYNRDLTNPLLLAWFGNVKHGCGNGSGYCGCETIFNIKSINQVPQPDKVDSLYYFKYMCNE